ncbi:MAG: CDP-archaeol synthase [Anaerolineae bacterium]|nr:CDP-archaeol synthase [Anaerolineae bacterium]
MPDFDLATRTLGSDIGRRFWTAIIGGPLVLLIVYLGGWLFTLAIVVVLVISTYELHSNVRDSRLLWSVWLYLIVALVYICLPTSLLWLIRQFPDGAAWVLTLFITNWATDGCALLGGRIFGRTRLAPLISPGKTVEGALTGIILGTLIGTAAAALLQLNISVGFIATVAISLLTVLGDLAESWLKRRLAVKDFGTLLPGHGGLLDRIDGLLFASVGLFLVIALLPR